MYRGRMDITVALVDVKKPDEYPDRKEFNHIFPSELKGPIPVGDITLNQFRQEFLDSAARRLYPGISPPTQRTRTTRWNERGDTDIKAS